MREYFYHDEKLILIKIKAHNRPSAETVSRRGTWVLREAWEGRWEMPCFPEVTWGTLKNLTYLGSRKIK